MDTFVRPERPVRVLLEMRPALGGNSGIPQENRLLFRALCSMDGVEVAGLLQTSDTVLPRGLPPEGTRTWRAITADDELNRLSRVVVSIEQPAWPILWRTVAHTVGMGFRHVLGGRQRLTKFDALRFYDFVWRRLFSRTLPAQDMSLLRRASFRIARVPWEAMHHCGLVTGRFGYSLYPRLDTSDFDVMIAETPYPATVSKRTRLIVRYHDAIPITMPHTIKDKRFHQASHYRALRRNVRRGAWFVCVSDAARNDLLSMFPAVERRSCTIHNMISSHYFDEESSPARIPEIIRARSNTKVASGNAQKNYRRLASKRAPFPSIEYLLVVSTLEPRKNHQTLFSAWQKLRSDRSRSLRLLLVGDLGWHHQPILRELRPSLESGAAFLLHDVPTAELRLLYKHARATICPSFGEGFDLSGVESMMSGGAVVASNIPVHHEVFADGAEYFNPYSVDELVQAIGRVIDAENALRRAELVERGARVAQRYRYEAILPKWQDFLITKLGMAV